MDGIKMIDIMKYFSNLSIRSKLLAGYITAFVLFLAISGLIIYPIMQKTIETNIESELNNTTKTILSMVKTAADASIKNYLRAVAEKNKDIVEQSYKLYKQGVLSEQDAKMRAISILLSQRIGKTGYIYCLDSKGIIRVHPVAALLGADLTQYGFIQDQLKNREGYIEYDWKNPGELKVRPKALYMTYFKPWDWIISVSSYREEFIQLINIDNFRDSILSIRFGKTGYPYVMDSKGTLIIHPYQEGKNIFDAKDASDRAFIEEICRKKNGKIIYPWQNPDESRPREKLVIFNYIPEFDWIVASSSYVEEFYKPLKYIRRIIIALLLTSLILLLFLTYVYSSYIVKGIDKLIQGFQTGSTGDFTARVLKTSEDEFGRLADYFNAFMEKLDAYNQFLQQEIAERKRTEGSLRESEEKHRTLVDNISIGVFRTIVGPPGRILQANPAMSKLTGYSHEELMELSLADVYQDPNERLRIMDELKTKGFVKNREVVMKKRDGTPAWASLSLTVRYDKQGAIKWIDGVGEDITERRKMEEELLKAQKLESVGLLAGGIAHDFNNLLTAILGNISLAKVSPLDKINERLDTAEKASLRAKDLTKQLLTFAKGGTPVRKTISIIEVIMNSAGFALSGSKATCEFEIPEDLWPVNADEGQISQVINNLIINAIQSMPEGGQITVRCSNIVINDAYVLPLEKGNYVRICVKDQGIGIPEENRVKIFDPYFTTKEHGRGLGLASTYAIIKNHEGHITVESRVGFGATFTVYLPASDALVVVSEERERKSLPGAGRVLIMDDEEAVREVAGKMLMHLGYEVAVAQNGAEAIEMYMNAMKSGRPFDVVIMDLTIPGGMGGKETIWNLKKLAPEIKAIVSSGYSNDPILSSFQAYGFAGVVLKPYRVDELGEQVRKVLHG